MKRLFVVAAMLLSVNAMFAQDTIVAQVVSEAELSDEPKNGGKVTLKPYGFVRDYLYYDSRQTYNTNAGLFEQIPKDKSYDPENSTYDLNSESEMNFLAITTRLGLNMSGVRALNADVTAKIEADFCGFTGNNFMIRLRQAYYKMQWRNNKHSLLMGQAWHPMTGDLPEVLALASGSPFQPFSRSPQLRYDYKLSNVNFTYAALWQFQYKTVGPTGYDPKFNKIPEMFLGIDYSNNGFKIGYGVDILSIVPRTSATVSYEVAKVGDDGKYVLDAEGRTIKETKEKKVRVDERLTTCSPMLYVNYAKNKFSVKAKGVLAENTAHLSMYNGFGVSEIHKNYSQEYTPIRSLTGWVDLCYGSKLKFNLFGGFSKNLGAKDELASGNQIFARNSVKNIDYMWRVCPAVSYTVSGVTFGLEYELTNVGYGKEVNSWADVEATRDVYNNRLCAMLKYAW
ncbi:MAG: hypothetical protein IKN77_03425 [Paludibacteraceae bacterium]|nr:hypothetical protein [Paludibacteraceae bacterium]